MRRNDFRAAVVIPGDARPTVYELFPIDYEAPGATVRPMIGRRASSLLGSLLVLAQLLTGPFAHAAPPTEEDCGPNGQTSHATTSGMMDCGDCPDGQAPPSSDSSNGDHHCRIHAACSCPCAHTPALGAFRPVIASPTPPECVSRVLAVPAFDPPLFDFLRPPN